MRECGPQARFWLEWGATLLAKAPLQLQHSKLPTVRGKVPPGAPYIAPFAMCWFRVLRPRHESITIAYWRPLIRNRGEGVGHPALEKWEGQIARREYDCGE
jgi:hypothetical protein